MTLRRKTWVGVGLAALAGTSLSTPAPATESDLLAMPQAHGKASPAKAIHPAILLAQGGEGGEGGGEGGEGGEGGGGAVESYSLLSTDPNAFKYDGKPEVAAYAAGVYSSYQAAVAEATKLQGAVDALLAGPTDATLAAARAAWVAARPAYLVTETFRFYDGPIEALEGQINAWPMNEAFIDYVDGKADAGLINDAAIEITVAALIEKNQVSDEADVTTGWHAVEFLLWGQDLNAEGPGNRPVSDFVAGQGNNDRRRAYLKFVTDQLVTDIAAVGEQWKPGGAYATTFLALPDREAIGRIMNGMAVLAGFEFMSERLAVALDSGDQEDEHSCFSDTTHQDFVYDLKGIENVWNGTYPGAAGPGVKSLVEKVDPKIAADVTNLLTDAVAKVGVLGDPWDKVLASPPDSEGRKAAEEAVASLQALGDGLKNAGAKLGVLVQIPSG